MDQVFAVRQVCEKYLAMSKMYSERLWICMEQACDTNRHAIWQILRCEWRWRKIVDSSAEFLCR